MKRLLTKLTKAFGNSANRKPRPLTGRPLGYESLEGRQMMTSVVPMPDPGDGVSLDSVGQVVNHTLVINTGSQQADYLIVEMDHGARPGKFDDKVVVHLQRAGEFREESFDLYSLNQAPNGISAWTREIKRFRWNAAGGNDQANNLTALPAVMNGGDGNDLLHGESGPDRLKGGSGNDILKGGQGHDKLWGQIGHDELHGGDGNDKLWGQAGEDDIFGNQGADFARGGAGADNLYGDEGNDRLWGGGDHDDLHGGEGNDRLRGGEGGGCLYGDEGDDRLWGGNGPDHMVGGEGNDRLWGYDGTDSLYGEEGEDFLYGHGGDDDLNGGTGSDRLFGGAGKDWLQGSGGCGASGDGWRDYLKGGGGADTFRRLESLDIILDLSPGQGDVVSIP